jgi:hypothetical protein
MFIRTDRVVMYPLPFLNAFMFMVRQQTDPFATSTYNCLHQG